LANIKQITLGQIAQAIGVSVARVSKLRQEGMPVNSIQAAVEWRATREDERRRLAPDSIQTLDDGSLFETLVSHRRLVSQARGVWLGSMEARDPNQGKYQSAYNQSLKTQIDLEEELERRQILAKEFIKSSEAGDAMRSLMSEVLQRLDKLALETAEGCNPENPAKAVKTLDAWVRKTRAELSDATE
jgi:hypothetical protein